MKIETWQKRVGLLVAIGILFSLGGNAQTVKILFDATKAETAGSADWVIDADQFNLGFGTGPAVLNGGNESNPQQVPTPAQSGITASTPETYWTGALSNWGIDCVKRSYIVETLPYNGRITYGDVSNAQDLSNYKVFIVCEPNILFTASEKTAILHFVQNGGGLFMVSDHTVSDRNNDGHDSPEIWNDLINNNGIIVNPFGFTFDLANFSETSTNIPVLPTDSLLHGPMGNVTSVKWSNGTSITLSPSINSSVRGVVYKTGSSFGNTGVMCAYARYGNGKVVAIGDSSPCDDGTGDPNDNLYNGYTLDASGNHQRLLMNATIWLTTSTVALALDQLDLYAAKGSNNSINIQWNAVQLNSLPETFSLQKSKDGVQFKEIYQVQSNNPTTSHFSFTDHELYDGPNYYRVAVSGGDRSGITYSKTVMVNGNPSSGNTLTLLPSQPGQLMIRVHATATTMGTVVLYDMQGRLVAQRKVDVVNGSQDIALGNIAQGMASYIVALYVNGNMLVQKAVAR